MDFWNTIGGQKEIAKLNHNINRIADALEVIAKAMSTAEKQPAQNISQEEILKMAGLPSDIL